MTVGTVSRPIACHFFLTLYKEHGHLKLLGIMMPNENRHQGGWCNAYLDMPHDIALWNPELRVYLRNDTVVQVKVREWHSWSSHVNVERCLPMTFELMLNTDQGSQPATLHVADWEPMPLPQQVEAKPNQQLEAQPNQQLETVLVYSHIRGEVTADKVSLLYTHMVYHQQLGIKEFWLYVTTQQSADLHASQSLRSVIDSGKLKLIYWPDVFCEEYSDCIESSGHQLKHQILVHNVARLAGTFAHKGLLILDTDEFIVADTTAINDLGFAEQVLQSHAQAVLPRYDSFGCRPGTEADADPDISLLKQDSTHFLDQYRTRSRLPHRGNKGKSLIDPEKMAIFGIHMGQPADIYQTLWQPHTTIYVLHLVNIWVVRRCEEDVEQIPGWNKATHAHSNNNI